MKIQVTTGGSRTSTKWTTREIPWDEFVEKCRTPAITSETSAQYADWHASKNQELKKKATAAKDAGGFIGATLVDSPGNKKISNIKERTLITLDADTADAGFRETVDREFSGVACVAYTTHSHTPEAPRWRVVFPLSRPVPPDKGERISRDIAGKIGVKYFDSSTHERARMFFWPSVSCDGKFESFDIDGEPLDPDKFPGDAPDWPEAEQESGHRSAAPERDKEERKQAAGKSVDPTTKPRQVGAFCRAYTVADAISRYLPHVYSYTGLTGKYTYINGSTEGGGWVTPDGYFYSHHDTDPAHGTSHNAFDLVRLHLFGDLDGGAKPGTPVNRLPSYLAMIDLCHEDPRVKVELVKAGLGTPAASAADFDGMGLEGDQEREPDAPEWMGELLLTGKGEIDPRKTRNFHVIMTHAPEFRGIGFDEFSRKEINRRGVLGQEPGEEITDTELLKMKVVFEAYGMRPGANSVMDALTATRRERGFNPVRDYLDSLRWDGESRLAKLLPRYFNAEDTPLNGEVTGKFFIASVKRIYEPGCKFDNVLVLVGREGTGKSTFFRQLFGDPYFGDALRLDQGDKERLESITGKWCVEVAEMVGYTRKESGEVKNYLSKQVDRVRKAYGRSEQDYPRQCVFCMTTNQEYFLRDLDQGNRRLWVVRVPGLDGSDFEEWMERLAGERDQLFAEAVARYRNGETLELSSESREALRAVHNECAEVNDDPLAEDVARWVYTVPVGDILHWSTFAEWAGKHSQRYDFASPKTKRKINEILRRTEGVEETGAVRITGFPPERKQRAFRKVSGATQEVEDGE